MASNLTVVEPLSFHQIHGEQIHLTEGNTVATRDRLNNNLVFSNRPIFPNEVVHFIVQDICEQFHGLIRVALTTINPEHYSQNPLPRSIPMNDNREWFVPVPAGTPDVQKGKSIRMKYTAEGDIFIDYDERGFVKKLTVSPIINDVWCALDLNGGISKIRIVQPDVKVVKEYTHRAIARYKHYVNNREQERLSIYYGGKLDNAAVEMNDCDEQCNLTYHIAVRKPSENSSSIIIEETLKRTMYMVVQILDMDHRLSNYLTIRCLTDGGSNDTHTKVIDQTFDHLTVGDEIGIRVQPDGQINFSCNNRHVTSLFSIDLTVNDTDSQNKRYYLEFIMNARVTALRLVGLHQPTDSEARKVPVTARGGCEATIVRPACPNPPSGLLLPCKHLCVCYECGKILANKHNCPKINCRKPVAQCVRVFKD